MTDNEIIKALECCSIDSHIGVCKECPLTDMCDEDELALQKHALDLINRQKAEIERLQKQINNADDHCRDFMEITKIATIKEFAEKITEMFLRYAHLHNYADQARRAEVETVDGTKIELFSVWDVLTLKKHEMAEYEEMSELQHNIEYIANDRLLTELEKDFQLLVKEMTEQRKEDEGK